MQRLTMNRYAETHQEFGWGVPDTFNFGADVVDVWAQDPERKALIWLNEEGDEKHFSYQDIKHLTNQFANMLAAQGVGRGDKVIIMLPRLPQWQIAMVGCNKLGAVPIPCVTMLTEKDIRYRVEHSGAVAAVTTAEHTHKFGDDFKARVSVGAREGWIEFEEGLAQQSNHFEPVRLSADDPAILFYTSGSTGLPKGVLHSARGLFTWRVSAWYWLSLTENDLMWCTADTGWSKAGTSILYGPWSCGCTVLFFEGGFDPEKRIDLLEKYGVSVFCAAATELRKLVQLDVSDRDLSQLRLTVSAGESVNPEVVRAWRDSSGSDLLDGYGQTETLMTIVNYPSMPVKPGSMGKPLPGTDAAILNETGNILPAGEPGSLAIKADNPQIMLGYLGDAERTASCYVEAEGQRWFLTGDNAYIDADGYIFYEGRDDDVINSAGYRIGPVEVENALMEHPSVQECAAVASPDIERGEVVKAFIILKEKVQGNEVLVKDIQNFTKQLTAPYKYPRKVEFVKELPKTATGKIQRKLLKQQEFGG
ncbi:acyl--CoA ligase [Maricurvus nonylphenolicus]|uniref:acyl-CoA synthetase n=1 Tax=Maricurvus nonylphenolicus TaxID=1008307 RepID=UPI0036F371AF